MSKFNFCLIMLALVSGIVFTGCSRGTGSSLVGTWINSDGLVKQFNNNGTWEVSTQGVPNTRGTYTVDGNTITRIMTHLHGGVFNDLEPRWYSESELRSFALENSLFHFMVILPFERQTEIYTYAVNGNTVIFTYTGTDSDETEVFSQTFTRR